MEIQARDWGAMNQDYKSGTRNGRTSSGQRDKPVGCRIITHCGKGVIGESGLTTGEWTPSRMRISGRRGRQGGGGNAIPQESL